MSENQPKDTSSIDQETLLKMTSVKEQMAAVKTRLHSVLDAFYEYPSLLTRASNVWGDVPTWEKIIGWILLFGSLITIGVLTQLIALIVVASICAAVFLLISYLLDDHFSSNQSSRTNLKNGMDNLASVLEFTITALDTIRQQLAAEIEQFKEANKTLALNIDDLHAEMNTLSEKVALLSTTEALLSATEKKLTQLTTDYETTNRAFETKVTELEAMKLSMGQEIEQLKKISVVLDGTVRTFTETYITESADRKAFQLRLDAFLADGKASFDQIVLRICQAEHDLVGVKNELAKSTEQYKKLLLWQEVQVNKLEKLATGTIVGHHDSTTTYHTSNKHGKHLTLFGKESPSKLKPVGGRSYDDMQINYLR